MEIKNITTGFTAEGQEKLKEMSKRYGVLRHMMIDAMIESVDEQSKEFKERIAYWQKIRGTKGSVSDEVASALAEAQGQLSEEDIIAVLKAAAEATKAA